MGVVGDVTLKGSWKVSLNGIVIDFSSKDSD